MSFTFKVAPSAARQIRQAAAWWTANRTKAPDAFTEDLEAALDLIAELPYIGELLAHPHIVGLRRILLGRVRYHLYYVPLADEETIEVLALWHTSRGRPPRI